MKNRKSSKNSNNAMEQELSFQKELLKKKTKTKTKTKTKNEKDPTCAIFSESRGFKDIKYDNFTKKTKTSKLNMRQYLNRILINVSVGSKKGFTSFFKEFFSLKYWGCIEESIRISLSLFCKLSFKY